MFRNVIRTTALQKMHINRDVYQTARVFARFLSEHQTTSVSKSNDQQSINQDEESHIGVEYFIMQKCSTSRFYQS